jgi:hypothetical protein
VVVVVLLVVIGVLVLLEVVVSLSQYQHMYPTCFYVVTTDCRELIRTRLVL